jgi:hypothetical protein
MAAIRAEARADDLGRVRRVYSAFDSMSQAMKLTLLTTSIIEANPAGAVTPIAALISVATIMAHKLSPAQQLELQEYMLAEASSLGLRLN